MADEDKGTRGDTGAGVSGMLNQGWLAHIIRFIVAAIVLMVVSYITPRFYQTDFLACFTGGCAYRSDRICTGNPFRPQCFSLCPRRSGFCGISCDLLPAPVHYPGSEGDRTGSAYCSCHCRHY